MNGNEPAGCNFIKRMLSALLTYSFTDLNR